MDKELEVYGEGFAYCSVCTNIEDIEEIEDRVNAMRPTGISTKWHLCEQGFATGQPNPCPCDRKPGFKHWLLSC